MTGLSQAAEIAQGKSASEAYVLAGYKAHDGNASTLRGNQKVSDRIAELMERAAVNTITTVETLLEAAWGIMKEARAKDDFSAASATLERAAKIAGLWVDQSKQQSANVTTVFSATPLTADEWSQQHSPETLQ